MSKIGSGWARTSPRSAGVGVALVMVVSLGVVLVGNSSAAAAGTAPIPKGVTTELRQAREDLQTLGTVLAGLGSQERAAEAELDTFSRDVTDDTLKKSAGGAAGAAAADEVSAAISQLFSAHAREFASLAAQAQAIHEEFVNTLTAAAGSYAAAEASATP